MRILSAQTLKKSYPVFSHEHHGLQYLMIQKTWRVRMVTSKSQSRDVPGGLVVKTLNFHCMGDGLNPWSGNSDLTNNVVWQKKQVLSDQGVRGKGWCQGWRQIGPGSRGRWGRTEVQRTHQKAVATWGLTTQPRGWPGQHCLTG